MNYDDEFPVPRTQHRMAQSMFAGAGVLHELRQHPAVAAGLGSPGGPLERPDGLQSARPGELTSTADWPAVLQAAGQAAPATAPAPATAGSQAAGRTPQRAATAAGPCPAHFFDRSSPTASPAAIASILQPALQQYAKNPSAGAGLDPCVLLSGLDQLQDSHGIMASYSVQMTPATRAAAGPFRAELLAADYGPLTGYAQHAVATDMRAFAALCKQSRNSSSVPTPLGVSKAASTFVSKIQQRMSALQQQVSFDPATFTQQLPLTSTALSVQHHSAPMPKKPELPLHALVQTGAMAMCLALARQAPAVDWASTRELQALHALCAKAVPGPEGS